MSSEIFDPDLVPVIVTTFRDFELEERVVRILAHRGFRIGERKIVGGRDLSSEEILITDGESQSAEFPVISIPWQAREWDDHSLQSFIRDQIHPPIPTTTSWPSVLVIAEGAQSALAGELVGDVNAHSSHDLPIAHLATFEERDLRSALVPTRRFDEQVRHARYAHARSALYLAGLDRKELALAHSMIEYQRRIHPHLALAFILVGGRKARRMEAASLLEPFPIFFLEDERDDFLRIWPSPRKRGEAKFSEIREWLGSLHGDSRQPRDLADRAPSRGARTSRRTGGAMATPRGPLLRRSHSLGSTPK